MGYQLSKNKEVKGIFYMTPPRAHYCTTYMLYNQLDETDGWLFAPLLELSVDKAGVDQDPDTTATLKRSVPQSLCNERTHVLNSVYIHQVHIVEMLASPAAESWTVEPGFVHQFEVDPDKSWPTLIEESERVGLGGTVD